MINPTYLTTSLGYSIVPVGTDKYPIIPSWKKYQERLPTPAELSQWFPAPGAAVVCGQVSGRLEVMDFDLKNDITGTLFDDFMEMVVDNMPEIAGQLVVAESRSKGRHIYYKCLQIAGNQKLASRHATSPELTSSPHLKLYGLIETRGEGGIIVVHPTPGYTWLQGDASTVPVITAEQRDELWNIARSFNTYTTPPEPYHNNSIESGYTLTPWADYNQRGDILALLQKHGYRVLGQQGDKVRLSRPGKAGYAISGDFHVVKRWFTLFTTSTEFEALKAYTPSAVLCKLECGDNWQKLYERLRDEGYGTKVERAAPEEIRGPQTDEDRRWWSVSDKGEVKIIKDKLCQFINEAGFWKYRHDPNIPTFDIVRVQNNVIHFASWEDIADAIISHIKSMPDRFDGITRSRLHNAFLNTPGALPKNTIETMLTRLENPQFLKDTPEIAYLTYLNGIVKVEAGSATLLPYSSFDRLIWRDAIIQRKIELEDDFSMECEFNTFVELICKDSNKETWITRKRSACSIIGYLIHKYKDRVKTKSVILMEQCDDYDKGGGTGKGLFMQAIGQMVKVAYKDGKTFDPGHPFAFQDITPATRILYINDTGKDFKIEKFNTIITDSIKTERKNKDSITLTYDESPKPVFDMNYAITDMANSAQRRIEVLEFSDHFGLDHTPFKEFGHQLIYEWDQVEFNRFDNFMIQCIRLFLSEGFIKVSMSYGARSKTIKQRYGEEFCHWFVSWVESGDHLVLTKIRDLYDRFIETHDVEKYTVQSFGRGIQFACKVWGLDLTIKRLAEPSRPRAVIVGNLTEPSKTEDEIPF